MKTTDTSTNRELHQTYLDSIIKESSVQQEAVEKCKSLHQVGMELNKVTGMYWTVCASALLGTGGGLSENRVKLYRSVLEKEMAKSALRLGENGGALRGLSTVQLVSMLFTEDERVKFYKAEVVPEVSMIVNEYFPTTGAPNVPFWFDVRIVYCLVVIMKISGCLDELAGPGSPVRTQMVEYVKKSQFVLGGFGASPGAEPHGGYTFCCVAVLTLLAEPVPRQNRLIAWLKSRLEKFNGRPGKPCDSCYIWWIGATLVNLGEGAMVDRDRVRISEFLNVNCFTAQGGISKYPSIPVDGDDSSVHGKQDADLLHTFLGIASLAMLDKRIDTLTALPLV